MKGYSKQISPEEARQIGVSYIHTISRCDESYRGSGLYVLRFNNGIKIGVSSNLKSRLKSYKYPWCREIEKSAFYKTQVPYQLELFLKRRFKSCIIRDQTSSTEYLLGVSFEYIVKFIEGNKFFE